MRMAFGLVSLLVVSAIVIFMMSKSTETSVKGARSAQDQLSGVTGRVPSNAAGPLPTATPSGGGTGGGMSPSALTSGGATTGTPTGAGARTNRPAPSDDPRAQIDKSASFDPHRKGLLVTDVFPGGYFSYFYGLQKGDIITDAGEVSLEGQGEAMLFQMAQQKRDLKVIRNGQPMTLQMMP